METERLLIQFQQSHYILRQKRTRFEVGHVGVHTFQQESADLGWMTYPEYRNQGFLKEALKVIIPDIFDYYRLNYLRVWVSKINPCGSFSERAALGAGFSYTHSDKHTNWFRLDREKSDEQRRVLERNQKVDREGLDTASIR